MPIPALYRERAAYYDAIYDWKDYPAEAKRLRELLEVNGVPRGARVIEAACGTGRHLVELGDDYERSGFDCSREMIEIAKQRLPEVKLWQADMTDFQVDQPPAAMLCLFSSIGYVFPEERLRRAASCFADALQPGGILIIEPWIAPEDFTPGFHSFDTHKSDELKLCRACVTRREGDLAVLDFHWLALPKGAMDVEQFTDRHELWLCPRDLMIEILDDAGFDCQFESDGLMKSRGLIIGRKRTSR